MQNSTEQRKESIIQFLRDFAQKSKLQFLFVCESGSRSHETSTANSDHDLKGIYLPQLANKEQPVHRITNASWKGVKCKIDYEFIPLNRFLQEIVQEDCPYLRWATSNFVYIDRLQGALQQSVQQHFNYPVGDISDRIKKDIAKTQQQGKRQAKKLLNMLVDSLLLVQHKLTGGFPPMAVGKLLDLLAARQDIFVGVDEIADLVQQIILMKKNGKGLVPIQVPPKAMELARIALSLPCTHPPRTKDQMLNAIAALKKQLK